MEVFFGNNIKKDKIMEKKVYKVGGMKCAHCKASVEAALMAVEGVRSAEVSLEEKTVVVECAEEVGQDTLVDAIEAAGRFFVE